MIEVQCTLARRWTENTNHVVSAWIAKLFERWREIPRERSRLAKLSSTKRGSKGRRIPRSVEYQGETRGGLMKTKVETEERQGTYVSTGVSASSPRGISGWVGCLFAGSFSDGRIFLRSRERRRKIWVEGLSLSFPSRPPRIVEKE